MWSPDRELLKKCLEALQQTNIDLVGDTFERFHRKDENKKLIEEVSEHLRFFAEL